MTHQLYTGSPQRLELSFTLSPDDRPDKIMYSFQGVLITPDIVLSGPSGEVSVMLTLPAVQGDGPYYLQRLHYYDGVEQASYIHTLIYNASL
jgi:hypothetical protein